MTLPLADRQVTSFGTEATVDSRGTVTTNTFSTGFVVTVTARWLRDLG